LHLHRLGLAGDENWTQVQQRYRELARRSHPDVPGGSTQSFQTIQDSYNYLAIYYGRAKPSLLSGSGMATRARATSAFHHSAYAEHVMRANGTPGLFLMFPALILVGLGSWVIVRNGTAQSQRDELRAGGTSRYIPGREHLILLKKPNNGRAEAPGAQKPK
jgi:hypothetical protein